MKYSVIYPLITLSVGWLVTLETNGKQRPNDTKAVLMVIAHQGYQPVEFETPKQLLEQAGYTITVASDHRGSATASDGTTTHIDILVSDVKTDDYAAIVLIGGPQSLKHLDNTASYRLVQQAYTQGKIVGASCLATRILAKAGILKGKDATGWNGDNQLGPLYTKYQVHYIPNDVIIDGKLITAKGPNAAHTFGKNIVLMLTS